jgi:hypothetical protein
MNQTGKETTQSASPSAVGEETVVAKWPPSYDHPRVYRNESNN